MKVNLNTILFTTIILASVGIVLFALSLFYDYYSNDSMEKYEFTPDPILSKQIKAFIFKSNIIIVNKEINSDLLAANIQKAFNNVTGRKIDDEPEYRSLILAIMAKETGLRYHKKILPWIPIPEIWLGAKSDGIMQATDVPNPNFYTNLVFNIRKLDELVQIYTHNHRINNNNVKYIFADWCSGIYSCKIASLQSFLNKRLSLNPPLDIDGILGKKTVAALMIFKGYNKTDAEFIIKNEIKKLEIKDSPGVEKYRENFINSAYYKNLEKQYPELQIPLVSETKVISIPDKIRNELSFKAGWLNSKEYAEKVFIIYKKLNSPH